MSVKKGWGELGCQVVNFSKGRKIKKVTKDCAAISLKILSILSGLLILSRDFIQSKHQIAICIIFSRKLSVVKISTDRLVITDVNSS